MTDDENKKAGPSSPSGALVHTSLLKATEHAVNELADYIGMVDWNSSRPGPVSRACDDVQLAAALFACIKAHDAPFRAALEADPPYREAVGAVRAAARLIGSRLFTFIRYGGVVQARAILALPEHAEELREGLFDVVAAFREVVDRATDAAPDDRKKALTAADEFVDELVARRDRERDMPDHEPRLTVAIRRYRTAGNATRSLGNEYDEHAKKEAQTANVLRVWVGALAVLVAGAAAWFNYRVTEATLLLELARLSVSIPLGLLALYLARESARHREAARWSRELAIALHSVDSYATASESKTDRRALRQALGMRVFGANPDTPAAAAARSDLLHTVVTKLTETVTTEVLGRLGLGGNGQKGGGPTSGTQA